MTDPIKPCVPPVRRVLTDTPATAVQEVERAVGVLTPAKVADAREKQRREDIGDSEYWCAFAFESRDQKEAFLQALGLLELGDKYLDGRAVAEKLGVNLSGVRRPQWPAERKNKRLEALVRTR